MSFWVYIVKCADGTYYAGHVDDLEQRLAAHQSGAFRGYTSKRRPIELVYAREFEIQRQAVEHKRQIKRLSRAKKEALIREHWSGVWQRLGKPGSL
jgi:predicted GIY-YIG superfamily endonuclease